MKFIHGIVTVNRDDLLQQAIYSIRPFWKDAFIIDNSRDGLKADFPIRVVRPSVPLTCGQSMNFLAKLAKEANADIFGYQHNDAICLDGQAQVFYDFVEKQSSLDAKWSCILSRYSPWNCFYDALSAYNMRAVNDIGLWDTRFPNSNYFIDVDWFRRAVMKGYMRLHCPATIKHDGSGTIKADPKLSYITGVTHRMNDDYWKAKWGIEFSRSAEAGFTEPFNGESYAW